MEKAGKRGARITTLAGNPSRFFSAAYGAWTITSDVEPLLAGI